jgi:hypothetical protein
MRWQKIAMAPKYRDTYLEFETQMRARAFPRMAMHGRIPALANLCRASGTNEDQNADT